MLKQIKGIKMNKLEKHKTTLPIGETHQSLFAELKNDAKKLLEEIERIESVANRTTSITLEYLGVMHGFEYRHIELMGKYYTLSRKLMA